MPLPSVVPVMLLMLVGNALMLVPIKFGDSDVNALLKIRSVLPFNISVRGENSTALEEGIIKVFAGAPDFMLWLGLALNPTP